MKEKAFISLKHSGFRLLVSLGIGFLFPGLFFNAECELGSGLFFKVGFTCSLMSYLIWEGNVWITNYFYGKFSWKDRAFKRLGYHVIVVLIYSNSVVVIGTFLMHHFFGAMQPDFDQWAFILVISSMISMLILTIHERIYYFKSWVASQKETQELKANYAEAQYNALKSQVNPHFLFNSLNTLASIIHENPDKATEFVSKLSGVYRYILKANEQDLATIEEELKVAEAFVFLLKTRFEEDVKVTFKVNENVDGYIPPISLQLLIENAVKHNIASPDAPLSINVEVDVDNIFVTNNLNEKAPDLNNSTKTGLRQIKQRYELNEKFGFSFNKTDGKFVVVLPIIKK